MNTYRVQLTSQRESTWEVQAESEDEVYSASVYRIREMGKCLDDREHDPEVAWVDPIEIVPSDDDDDDNDD